MTNNIVNSSPRLRIEYLLKNIQLVNGNIGTSANNFAWLIGLKRSDAIYKITRNNGPITVELANRIVNTFPACSVEWLLNGEGEAPQCPIRQVPTTTANPWWPDKQSGNHSAPITGCWLLVKTLHCFTDRKPMKWVESPKEKNATPTATFLEFKQNKLVDRYENQYKMKSDLYAYNSFFGFMTYGERCILVSRLDQQYLECIVWNNLTENDIVKYVYRRIPESFDKSKGSILVGGR